MHGKQKEKKLIYTNYIELQHELKLNKLPFHNKVWHRFDVYVGE